MEENNVFNIDEGLKRLEEINQKLASPNITLNESMKLYIEGTKLAEQCRETLSGVEKQLKILGDNTDTFPM